MESRILKIVRLVIELLFFIGAIAACVVLYGSRLAPFDRGFFCSDNSLKYPYKNDSITITAVSSFGLGVVFLMIIVLEGLRSWFIGRCESKSACDGVKSYLKAVGWNLAVVLFGAAFNFLMTEILKISIGRLRPDFFDVCKPDFTSLNCSAGYMTRYSCISTADPASVLAARKSFPSGHASFIGFCMTYVIIYLQLRVPRRTFRLMRSTLQFGAAIAVLFVCSSRITDYKHHYSDVIGGAIIGIVGAVFTIACISDVYHHNQDGHTDDGTTLPMTTHRKSGSHRKEDIE